MNFRLVLGSACMFAVAVTAGFLIPTLDKPLDPHTIGRDLMAQGRAREAAYLFDDPVWKGVAEYRADRLYRAAGEFVQTKSALSLYNLGTAYAQVKQWPGAVAAYEAVLRLEPEHPDAIHNLSLVRRARAEEQREIEENRREKRMGIWQDGMLRQPEKSDTPKDLPVRKDGESGGGGESKPSRDPGNESSSSETQGTAGNVAPDGKARGGAAEAGDENFTAPEGLTGASAARHRRAESIQQAEQHLRKIVDRPEQVLAARLRAAHKLREGNR